MSASGQKAADAFGAKPNHLHWVPVFFAVVGPAVGLLTAFPLAVVLGALQFPFIVPVLFLAPLVFLGALFVFRNKRPVFKACFSAVVLIGLPVVLFTVGPLRTLNLTLFFFVVVYLVGGFPAVATGIAVAVLAGWGMRLRTVISVSPIVAASLTAAALLILGDVIDIKLDWIVVFVGAVAGLLTTALAWWSGLLGDVPVGDSAKDTQIGRTA